MIESSPWPTGSAAAAKPWKAFHWWSATSLAYISLYGMANQLTSLRADVGQGVFSWERSIPFVGWSIVPYLSIVLFFTLSFFIDADRQCQRRHVARLYVVLFVSVLCYAVFPLRYTFERPPTHGLVGLMFDLLGVIDMPYNRAPSLHIGVLLVLWARFAPGLHGWRRWALHGWFALIAASVLTTYQHHVLDVPAGAALGAFAIAVTRTRAQAADRRAGCRVASAAPMSGFGARSRTGE